MLSFAFDASKETPQSIAQRRRITEALQKGVLSKTAQSVPEGIGQLLAGVVGGIQNYRANKAEAYGSDQANKAFQGLNLFGGAPSIPSYGSPSAMSSPQTGAAPASASPQGSAPPNDVATGIVAAAKQLGINPMDLGTAISYETAGTFDPTKAGPRTQWGQHKGLIQWGEPQAKKYGVDWSNPVGSQLGENGAVVKYLQEAGVRPGMDLMDIYSAINAGRVGRYNASDANNGGAPGTVADKVNQQMSGHREKAQRLLAQYLAGDQRQVAQAAPQAPQQAPMQPAAMPQQPMVQPAANAGPDVNQLAQFLANPYAPPEQKAVAQMALEQALQQRNPMYQMQMQSAQQGLTKGQLEIDALKNPKPEYDPITSKDGSVFRFDKRTGKLDTLYGSKPEPEKPTDDMREYDLAKSQGYTGTFQQYITDMKRAGATQVNIDQKAEGAFDKTLAESQAKAFDAMATDGMNARAEMGVIDQLDGLLQGQGGALTGLSGKLAQYGIGGEGVSDLQAAQALINKLIPSQRQPGSGSMSDRDVDMFRESLPSLWNTPQGNKTIIQTMRGLAEYKQKQGAIAQAVQMGELDRKEAVKALKALPNPLAGFAKTMAPEARQQQSDAPPPGFSHPDLWQYLSPEEKKLWQN